MILFDLLSSHSYSFLFAKLDTKILGTFLFQEALKRRLNARMEYAKFLQDTVKEQVGVQTQSWGYANQRKEHSFLRGWTNFLSIEDLFSG